MKLISLNTWGGRIYQPLIDFISQHSKDTDIFCFQEVYTTSLDIKQYKGLLRTNLLEEFRGILPEFRSYYFPNFSGYYNNTDSVEFDLSYGQAIFIKKTIKVIAHKNYFIQKYKNFEGPDKMFSNIPTPLQKIQFSIDDKIFSVFNFHGTPYPSAKKDTRRRLKQSTKVKTIMDSVKGAKILVGDFNLSKNTKSIRIFEDEMRNLIKEFKIKRTRSKVSPFYGKSNFQKFADYTFVSPDIKVENFQVPDIEISDHLPMILEFN